jgi:hypothetical protein
MPSFDPATTAELDAETNRLAIEALAAILRDSPLPVPQFECPDHVWRQLQNRTGMRPSYIGRHWDRVIARAKEMRSD